MKILVTGSNGQLGSELRGLAKINPGFEFLFTDVDELDITQADKVSFFFQECRPDVLINCAAYTAVDKAEQEPDLAMLINAKATGILARECNKHQTLMIHISTDYVFDGKGFKPYSEEDKPNPVSSYAKSKYTGELEIQQLAGRAIIIRTSWLYSEFGNNFMKTIVKYGRERGVLNVIYDQTGAPTYACDLAKTILVLLSRTESVINGVEIYHYANEGVASWFDFAKAIVEMADISCKINAIETKDYPLPAVRPHYSVFNKAKIKQQFDLEIPYWRDSLKECIRKSTNSLP